MVRKRMISEIESIRTNHGSEVIHVLEVPELPIANYIALNIASELAVVSLFWDGLNLFPYEYTACQDEKDPGSLIISKFMGCSRSLSGLIRVNPWHIVDVANAIHSSLSLSKEVRVLNHTQRYKYVLGHSVESWAKNFLQNLDRATNLSSDLEYVQLGWGTNLRLVALRSDFSLLDADKVVPRYRNVSQRILIFDYDGTLNSGTGGVAQPSEQLLQWLKVLSAHQGNHVFIVSGRSRKVLDQWFGSILELGLAAEKGCFIRWPASIASRCRDLSPDDSMYGNRNQEGVRSDFEDWENMCHLNHTAWKEAKEAFMQKICSYTRHTDGSWIEPKEYGIVWHYDQADPEYGIMQASELLKYLQEVNSNPNHVEVVRADYSRILEVKPVGVGKGSTCTHILQKLLALKNTSSESPLVMCIGDDRSDEEMFVAVEKALTAHLAGENVKKPNAWDVNPEKSSLRNVKRAKLPNLFTVCVGIKPSHARFYVHDTEQVLSLIEALQRAAASDIRFGKTASDYMI
jgi:trehalose 6-phosphate synthase/phosphatase